MTPIKAVALAVAVASVTSWLVVADSPGQPDRAYAISAAGTTTGTSTATPAATTRPCNVVPHSFRPRTIR